MSTACRPTGRSVRARVRLASRSAATQPGGWSASTAATRKLEGGAFITPYSSLALLASWILRQGRPRSPVSPPALRREVQDGLKLVQERHEGDPPKVAAETAVPSTEGADERPASPVPAERFGLLQALLAYLLDACGEEDSAVIPAADLLERFNLPEESLDEHLQLLNLVNFGEAVTRSTPSCTATRSTSTRSSSETRSGHPRA